MVLYYDNQLGTYSLKNNNEVEFLGSLKHAMLKLQEYGMTETQSRAAVIQAQMNRGDGVDCSLVRKLTAGYKRLSA